MGFSGGETDSWRDSGLAWPKEGETVRVSERERAVDGGAVNLTMPPFTQVIPPLNPEKNSRKPKTKRNKWSHLFCWWSASNFHSFNINKIHPFFFNWLTRRGASSWFWLTAVYRVVRLLWCYINSQRGRATLKENADHTKEEKQETEQMK